MNVDIGTLVAIAVPFLAIQFGLMVAALYDMTRPERRVKGGNKMIWALVVIFINIAGPIIYFLVGREDA